MIMITGGAGFIGSNFVLKWISEEKKSVVNIDKLTSAGNLNNLSRLEHHNAHHFVKGDIRNRSLILEQLNKHKPTAIVNCAAEIQLERSSNHPEQFIQTNVVGTFELLEAALSYWKHLPREEQTRFRFLQISTDEVFGTLSPKATSFAEHNLYAPNTPYAASRAAADHLVRSYHKAHGLPTMIAHCSNVFGPYQFPKRLIPFTIVNALQGNSLQVSDDGQNTRSWMYVGDCCAALGLLLSKGTAGEAYNISESSEIHNLDLVGSICTLLDELKSDSLHKPHSSLIRLVKDRPNNEHRQTLDSAKIRNLGWRPKETFQDNLRRTVNWYLHNMPWVENIVSGEYRDWISAKYPEAS